MQSTSSSLNYSANLENVGFENSSRDADTYEIYTDDDRYSVPTLHLVVAADEARALNVARRLIADSPHHLGAEVCLRGRRVAGFGSFAFRRLPPETAASAAPAATVE